MTQDLPLPLYKKLSVLFRLEPGCLGPDGMEHIEAFCTFAKNKVTVLHSDFVRWKVTPRYDKSLPETEYKTKSKRLDHDKAEKYLQIFGQDLDTFEEQFQELLANLIDEYHGR
ncbi:hypothetical protein [Agaribacter marinus]|uniref:Uncharacterized protein n=1 Tax=Agaribacter marinus TaxID=1431249 RepID=A0AA37WIU3_9ALTE|nr:hypothetical protein [Agaribacter marinus]GLR71507.1 hypothetical protein GCM10007852_24150 [Agaribacter marinus]